MFIAVATEPDELDDEFDQVGDHAHEGETAVPEQQFLAVVSVGYEYAGHAFLEQNGQLTQTVVGVAVGKAQAVDYVMGTGQFAEEEVADQTARDVEKVEPQVEKEGRSHTEEDETEQKQTDLDGRIPENAGLQFVL